MTFMKRYADGLAALALVGVVLVYAAGFVDFNIPPFEDAAMLMRYADHLAHGYGIVWNIGGSPVDGATDFLFMVVSAGLIHIGLPLGRAVRSIGLASHLATVLLVYWVNRRCWRANIFLSLLTALYLAVGVGLSYVAAFFGTPFFGLFALLTWTSAIFLIQTENSPAWLEILFAVSGLCTGLIRPEGVILSILMLAAILIMKGWRGAARAIAIFSLVFLLLGGIYFIWHWRYFGYPLPNPFYKKSGGLLHWDSLLESLGNLLRLSGPFAFAFLLGLRAKKSIRMTIAFLVPLIGFAAAFILISNEMNFGARFQYALLPLVLVSWFPLVAGLERELGFSWPHPGEAWGRWIWQLAGVAVVVMALNYSASQKCLLTSYQVSCAAVGADGRYDMARLLAQYRGKGYVIATTEAGLLPLYSGWSAADTWGLNDEWIAHHGEITSQYLDQYKPDLIVFHAYFSPLVPPKMTDKNLSQDWFRMTVTLMDYAEQHGYILAAAFGDSPYETHYYYVRPDFPDSASLVQEISSMKNYYWFTTGKKSINYARIQPKE